MRLLRLLWRLWGQLSGQFWYETLIRTLRSSFLIGGAAVIVSSTGAWKYLVSSFAAHDFVVASSHPPTRSAPSVVAVAIDRTAYRGYFGDRSPLDPARLQQLLETISDAAPQARAIVIDIDTAPWSGHPQRRLVRFFAANPRRWVLAEPGLAWAGRTTRRIAWRQRLCSAGVRLGLPYLPTDFGFVSTGYQFAGGLSQVAVDPGFDCARMQRLLQTMPRSDGQLRLRRIPAPMAPDVARQGVVIPFHGDLAQLGMLLRETMPQWIVVGGAWGRNDRFDTPVGQRYGMQLQAAALAGRLRGYRLAPLAVQLLAAWMFLAVMDLLLGWLHRGVERWLDPWKADYAGHRFLAERMWPITLVVLVTAGVLVVSYAGARLWMRTGYWVASPVIAAAAFVNVLFVWKWGLSKPQRHSNTASAWKTVFVDPVRTDWGAVCAAARDLRARVSTTIASPERPGVARSLVELLAAGASLLVQTGFPLLVIWRALSGAPL